MTRSGELLPIRFERSGSKRGEERVLPLVNIVFLLLIFFMLAGRLTASDPFRVEPPRSLSGADAAARDLIVLVGAQGRLALDGEVMEPLAIRSAVSGRVTDDAAVSVLVKADGQVEAVRVVAVIELLRETGIRHLKLLTVPEER